MKKIILYLFVYILISCTSFDQDVPSRHHLPKVIEDKPLVIPSDKSLEVVVFNKAIYESISVKIMNTNDIIPQVSKGELFIDEFFPENKILRLIALKQTYFSFNEVEEGGFSENEVTVIHSTGDSYYVGTRRGGLIRYSTVNDSYSIIQLPDYTLYNRSITGILSLNDKIVISSYSGLFVYETTSEEIINLSSKLIDRGFISLCKIGSKIYAGTAKGYLYSWDSDGLELALTVRNTPISLISYVNGYIIIGLSGKGLHLFNLIDSSLTPVDFVNNYISDQTVNVVSFFDDRYYVGTTGDGLLSFNKNLEIKKIDVESHSILCSSQSENIIYFGTHDNGLLFYDKIKEKWSSWSFTEGLSSLYIPAVFFHNENIYISTPDKGIVIINEQVHEKNL